jgi:hypothetical protein
MNQGGSCGEELAQRRVVTTFIRIFLVQNKRGSYCAPPLVAPSALGRFAQRCPDLVAQVADRRSPWRAANRAV